MESMRQTLGNNIFYVGSMHLPSCNQRQIHLVNYFLNKEMITILKIKKRGKDFHARYSAKMRIYRYVIINRLGRPMLEKNRCWHVMNKLDVKMMKKAAKELIGTNDFSTFRASTCRAKSPVKTMKSVKIKSYNNKIDIEYQYSIFFV